MLRIIKQEHDDVDIHAAAIASERCLLGCLFEDPTLWAHCASLTTDHFLLTAHRQIWETLRRLHRDEQPTDLHHIALELRDHDAVVYAAGLVDGTVLCDIRRYVAAVKSHAALRRARERIEELPSIHSVTELKAHLALISELLERGGL